jgi:hypothetical protein
MNCLNRSLKIIGLVLVSVLALSAPADAETTNPPEPNSGDTTFGGQATRGAVQVRGEELRRREQARAGIEQARAASKSPSGPVAVTFLVVACPGNNPRTNFSNSIFCDNARLGCEMTEDPNDILYWIWPGTRNGQSVEYGPGPTGEQCVGPDAAPEDVVPEFTLADFRRLPLPPGTGKVQPDNGYTVINVPTNVYAEAEPVTIDTTLLGFPVQVRATPERYTWDFGDGSTLGPTEDAGAAYPELRTTHEYTDRGKYEITLTTHYSGEYSVAGGPWLPVNGEATVTSQPVPIQALAGRNRLVAAADQP